MTESIEIVVTRKHQPWVNQMRFTPSPKVRTLIEAMNRGDEHLSETINYILTDYFNKMPTPDRQRLIGRSKHHY